MLVESVISSMIGDLYVVVNKYDIFFNALQKNIIKIMAIYVMGHLILMNAPAKISTLPWIVHVELDEKIHVCPSLHI